MPALKLPPLSLYIHFPWCVRKCPYCDFNSHEFRHLPEAEYVDALIEDLVADKPFIQAREIQSIFMGGGTPSLFSAGSMEKLLQNIAQHTTIAKDAEITLEANPGTAEAEKFKGFRRAGINRLSIGVQSFDNAMLEKLQRIHSAEEAIRAFEIARHAGFDNINIDLMHGLSQQTHEMAFQDLKTAFQLSPEHISWYQLTIEPNTAYYNNTPPLPSDDEVESIQISGLSLLEEYGYQRYEISAYHQSGKQSTHNLNYWTFGDYLAIGAGAHSKITLPELDEIHRNNKTRQPNQYLEKNSLEKNRLEKKPLDKQNAFTALDKIISRTDLPLEFMMNALRLKDGLPAILFMQRTGLELSDIEKTLAELIHLGLLSADESILKTTPQGYDFLNEVLTHF